MDRSTPSRFSAHYSGAVPEGVSSDLKEPPFEPRLTSKTGYSFKDTGKDFLGEVPALFGRKTLAAEKVYNFPMVKIVKLPAALVVSIPVWIFSIRRRLGSSSGGGEVKASGRPSRALKAVRAGARRRQGLKRRDPTAEVGPPRNNDVKEELP